jgi:hypothetical protein
MNSEIRDTLIWRALDSLASAAMEGANLWPRIEERLPSRGQTSRRFPLHPTSRLGWIVLSIVLFAILGGAAVAATPALLERFTRLDESAEVLPPDGPTLAQHLEWELPGHPGPMHESMPDKATIKVITAGRIDNLILILATANAVNGTPLYLYRTLQPLDRPLCMAEGVREECPADQIFTSVPLSGGSGPLIDGVPVFIEIGGRQFEPNTTWLAGYLNADPNQPLTYRSNGGERKTIEIEEPAGILLFEDLKNAPEVNQP